MTGTTTRRLQVLITLRSALLMRTPADTSRRVTLDHIPGTAIQGMLANALAGTPELITAAVQGRSIHIAPAYPTRLTTHGWLESIPTPRSWVTVRDDITRDESPRDLLLEPTATGSVTPLPPYIAEHDATLVTITPQTQLRDRNTGDRTSRTVGPNGGTPFQDLLLCPGQSFLSTWLLHAATPTDLDALVTLLDQRLVQQAADGRLVLGGGGTGAGGHITITLDPPVLDNGAAPAAPAAIAAGQIFTVMARTPIHVLDSRTGTPCPGGLAEAIVTQWGPEAVSCADAQNRQEVAGNAFVGRVSVGGYNSLYRHDLPPTWCAAAGSVVRLTARRDLSTHELADWLAHPVGGRSAQGCGHLAILDEDFAEGLPAWDHDNDWLSVPGLRLGDGEVLPPPATGASTPTVLSTGYLDLLLARPLQEAIPQVAQKRAESLVGDSGAGPSRHLWAVLEREFTRPPHREVPTGSVAPLVGDLLSAIADPDHSPWRVPTRIADKLGRTTLENLRAWSGQDARAADVAEIANVVVRMILGDQDATAEVTGQIRRWITDHRDTISSDLFVQTLRRARRLTAPQRAENTGVAP